MRRRGNLNRLVHGLTNTREGIPGCPPSPSFAPGLPTPAESDLRRLLGCDGTVPMTVTQLMTSVLSWRHTAGLVSDPDRTWRPDMQAMNFFSTEGDLDIRPWRDGRMEFRPKWERVPSVPDLVLAIQDNRLLLRQGDLHRYVSCPRGFYAMPEPGDGVRCTLVRKDGETVRDGDQAIVRGVVFAYPYAEVMKTIQDSPTAMTMLLEAGVAGYFGLARTPREAVALAAAALAIGTLKRTGY